MAKPIASPKGIAKYPWLNEADTKFEPEGVFKTNHIVPLDVARPFIEKLEADFEAAWKAECQSKGKKLKKAPLPWEVDEDEGIVTFKYKLVKTIKKKDGSLIQRKVALMDAKGTPVNPKAVKVGSGSEIRLSFTQYYWFSPSVGFGLQLQLVAAKILKLVEAGNDRDYGFGDEEEEGYTADSDTSSFGGGNADTPWDDGDDTPASTPAAGGDDLDF